MVHRFRALAAFVLATVFVSTLYSCHENTIISSRVSPSNNTDSVYAINLPCITHTYYVDSAVTSTNVGYPIYQGVGAMHDFFFGNMVASTYFQVIPTDADTISGATYDSAVLVLPYGGFTYGDTTTDTVATFQAFYMTDSISYYGTYYSTSTKSIDAAFPLSAPVTVPIAHLRDSMYVSGIDHSYIRIPLNREILLSHILPAWGAVGATGSIESFISGFNGICVRPANVNQFTGCMPYFELDGTDPYSQAGILLYYRDASSVTDSPDYIENFYFNTGICAHFNAITKSYTQYPINKLLHSTQANDQVIALQNTPGANIDIVIPGLKKIPAGLIARAAIELTILPGTEYNDTVNYQYPESLSPIGLATTTYHPFGTTYAGEAYTVYDLYPTTSSTPLSILDGTMHPLSTGATFTVDLPREVIAAMAAGTDTLHYHLSGTVDYPGAFHLVAGGGTYGMDGTADTNYRAKIKIVYSKLSH